MADLKAMLAAKRAAQNPTPLPTQAPVPTVEAKKEQEKQEPAAPVVEKPLTFAEKMALKKTASPTPAEAPIATNAPASIPEPVKEEALRTGTINPALDAHPPVLPSASPNEETPLAENDSIDPVIAQAYADISQKINLLESLEDTALEGAMKELKKALMANPNAVSLMLDTDYGKMVVALRKITREAQVEAASEKKVGAKKKDKPLSAEQIASVFEEL